MKTRTITVSHGTDGYTLIIIDGVTIPVRTDTARELPEPTAQDRTNGIGIYPDPDHADRIHVGIPAGDGEPVRCWLSRADADRLVSYIRDPDGGDDGLGIEPAESPFLDWPADI